MKKPHPKKASFSSTHRGPLVKKELSLDKTFKGDFNLKEKIVSRNNQNRYIYTGLQIIERSDLSFISKDIF